MEKIHDLQIVYTKHIPRELENGVLYISKEFKVAIHLCACGCGVKTVTPLGANGWTLTEVGAVVSLRPSIGNFKGESPYHAHYFITSSAIEWL